MSFAAIGIGLTAVSVGVGAAGAAGAFSPTINQPNLPASSKALSDTEASLLPLERGMAAAAQEGGKYTFSLPAGVDGSQYGFNSLPQGSSTAQETQVFVPGDASSVQPGFSADGNQTYGTFGGQSAPAAAPQGQWVPYNAADFQSGGKYASLGQPQLRTVTNNNGTYTVDFNGYGAGQTQATIAKQAAAGQLALSQKYDPQFIAASLAQEKEADPQSFAARQMENDLIQKQITNPPENPVADTLSDQVDAQVKSGKGLDPMETGVLNSSVASALADRGGNGAGADFTQPLTTGAAGVARQQAGIQKGIGELSSGSSPEDIDYRREQQNLANISALMSGQTPTSEFRSLSASQNGPTPYVSGPQQPQIGSGGSAIAGNAAIQSSGIANQLAGSQSNPWLSGISTLLSGATAFGQLGFKPLAAPGPNG